MQLKFADNLKLALKERNITQSELAAFLQTTQPTINRWLNKVNEPDLATLMKICNYLDISADYLLGLSDM